MSFIKLLLGQTESHEIEVQDLRKRLEESEKNVEKLLDMVNILAAFDEKLSSDLRIIASHVALMEMSMADNRKRSVVSLKRKSNDDDMIN